jgi:hypothetical protein
MGNKLSVRTSSESIPLMNNEQRSSKNQEEITLLWYEPSNSSDLSNENKIFREKIQEVIDYVVFYNNETELLEYIKSITSEEIFLILLSHHNNDELLFQIHNLNQLYIIIFYGVPTEGTKRLEKQYDKIFGCCSNQSELIDTIRIKTRSLERRLAMFNSFDDGKQVTTRDLTSESGSFLFFQLFQHITRNTKNTDELKQRMIAKCRDYYSNKNRILKQITEFEQTYQPAEAIRWYTKQSFLYRLLNKALRTEDIEGLSIFQFYITDLSLSLKEMFLSMKIYATINTKFTVYRGSILSDGEIERLRGSVGKLISLNGYTSTSRSHGAAWQFAGNLFIEIEMDLNLETVICADIAKKSHFEDEEEVLFDIGESLTEEKKAFYKIRTTYIFNDAYRQSKKNYIFKMNFVYI